MNLPKEAWRPHPQGFEGNAAVSLIANNGESDNDLTYGAMQPTQWLNNMPYIRRVLASFKAPLGRTRLMRIKGQGQVPKHTDLDYYWIQRVRIHIPIITNEAVQFECGEDSVHMAAGEAWVFDTTQLHRVINPQGGDRIHLVIDTVGSQYFNELMSGNDPSNNPGLSALSSTHSELQLPCEQHNRPTIMSPHEQQFILNEFLSLLADEHEQSLLDSIKKNLQPVLQDWRAAWAVYGSSQAGFKHFKSLSKRLESAIKADNETQTFRGSSINQWLKYWLLEPALNLPNIEPHQPNKSSKQSPKPIESNGIDHSYTSQYTESFPGLIEHLGGTLAVTTYASNRLVLLRANGAELNTHFKEFTGPMGLAFGGGEMAMGVQNSIWFFRSQPDLCATAQPHSDAVYVPTKRHMTGDIRVHELGWAANELWMVNTRFSCLATFDENHSFVPRWQPHFINKLNAEDACHLNGMAMTENGPMWVSALGVSDQASGWRKDKLDGGVVMDVNSGEIVTGGLCMPHSPRWHGDRLWVLNSGRGGLCEIDPSTGDVDLVTRLPGFTRGLAMIDRYAFVGCSRVRESAWFGGLPILEKKHPPECGVWAVDLVTGEIIGWLKFDEGIDEIFDLQWLPQLIRPEILEPDESTSQNAFTLPAENISKFR